jgi:hypothetical protein
MMTVRPTVNTIGEQARSGCRERRRRRSPFGKYAIRSRGGRDRDGPTCNLTPVASPPSILHGPHMSLHTMFARSPLGPLPILWRLNEATRWRSGLAERSSSSRYVLGC